MKPLTVSWSTEKEIELKCNNEQELIDLIEDGLTTDKTNQTEKAYQFIVSNHTFEKRVEQMLDILYNHA